MISLENRAQRTHRESPPVLHDRDGVRDAEYRLLLQSIWATDYGEASAARTASILVGRLKAPVTADGVSAVLRLSAMTTQDRAGVRRP